ncbi:MAG: hypothetical protein II712_01760 [Erysipelotrichaceae bacterium]|nr:hypothetical protein [Erysipelotrichaceae bacterium]
MKKRSKAAITFLAVLIAVGIIAVGKPVKIEDERMLFVCDFEYFRPSVSLNGEDNTFVFCPSMLLSAYESGTYEISGLRLELKCDSGNHYSFFRIGKYLLFLRGRSSVFDEKVVIKNLDVFALQKQ